MIKPANDLYNEWIHEVTTPEKEIIYHDLSATDREKIDSIIDIFRNLIIKGEALVITIRRKQYENKHKNFEEAI